MIRYDLICDRGHSFDGWFRDSATYDAQQRAGHITCPTCGSANIDKQLMAPRIPAKSNTRADEKQPVFSAPASPEQRALTDMMRKLRRHVEETADYVGDQFAEEARKIHYGETAERGIYGEASLDETKSLLDEGIEVAPLPKLPENGN